MGVLVSLCIEAATKNIHSVQKWRRQRRTLERLPCHLGNVLFRRLLLRGILFPSLLESVTFLSFSFTRFSHISFVVCIHNTVEFSDRISRVSSFSSVIDSCEMMGILNLRDGLFIYVEFSSTAWKMSI